jgi:hypothetical protein
MLHVYHVVYSVRYYPRFHVTAVGLGTYYPWIVWQYCTSILRSGDRIPVGARFFAHVETGPGALPASCTMGTVSFPGVNWPGRGADHPPLLAPRLRMSKAVPLSPSRPLVACYRVNLLYQDPKRIYHVLDTDFGKYIVFHILTYEHAS